MERIKNGESLPVPKGFKLIFPDFGFVYGISIEKGLQITNGRKELSQKETEDVIFAEFINFSEEYFSLLGAILREVGPDNLILVDTAITLDQQKDDKTKTQDAVLRGFKEYPKLQRVILPSTSRGHLWLRDVFCTIGETSFVNPRYYPSPTHSNSVQSSTLSEGGSVLVSGNQVIMSENLYNFSRNRKALDDLRRSGITIASLPWVDTKKQTFNSPAGHLDSHVNLIRNNKGELYIIVAKSYSMQNNQTAKKIGKAREKLEAQVVTVDDSKLPPFAFNFIQLNNNRVIMTSRAPELSQALGSIIGEELVVQTRHPFITIPRYRMGGIRCLTNVIPQEVLDTCSQRI